MASQNYIDMPNDHKYSPWFSMKETPVRPGLYQVVNSTVWTMSDGNPFGYTYQLWDGERWIHYENYGFYGQAAERWRGHAKSD